MRAALFGLLIACGTAEAASVQSALAAPPWYGSPCSTPADCVPAGQSVPAGVTCAAVRVPDGKKICGGGVLACEIYADGGMSACGPGACCWGHVTEYDAPPGTAWHTMPGPGECNGGESPKYCGLLGKQP